MVHTFRTDTNSESHTNDTNSSVQKVHLKDLQYYFDENVLDFEKYDDSEDSDAAFSRQYKEQATDFLQRIGAMVDVEKFFNVASNEIVSIRKVPPGITPVKA